MRVIHYPVSSNEYNKNLEESLAWHGVLCERVYTRKQFFIKMFFGNSDALHFHWTIEISSPRNYFFAALSGMAFSLAILFYKMRSKRVFWTFHNLKSHEVKYPLLEKMIYLFFLKVSDRIFVHGTSAINAIQDEYGIDISGKSSVAPHGNYPRFLNIQPLDSDIYPDILNILCVGNIRPYKGFENMIEAVKSSGMKEINLRVCGKALSRYVEEDLKKRCDGYDNIEIRAEFVSDEDLNNLLNWCHFVALPYKNVHTSGVALLALSAARPVIAPMIGLLPEYLDHKFAILTKNSEVLNLEGALRQAYLQRDLLGEMSMAARDQALKFNWQKTSKIIADAYMKAQ